MKQLYTALLNRLKTQVPELQSIDLFSNQLDNMIRDKVVFFPAVFIEFEQINFVNKSENIQEADVRLRFYLAQSIIGLDSYEGSENFVDALTVFDLKDRVNQALIYFTEPNTSDFKRVQEIYNTQYSNVYVIELLYECLYVDGTHWIGNDYDQTIQVTLQLDTDLIIDNPEIRTGILPQ
jgi:hypothetical protein